MSRQSDLETMIKKYATAYYSGSAIVSDETFDALVDELRGIDSSSPVLTTGWGYTPDSTKKLDHLFGLFIGSLDKVKSLESIPVRFIIKLPCRVSAKLDGLSVVSYYHDGRRFLSLTRGNGITGIDVTDKITVILKDEDAVVYCEDGTKFTGAVRGEVVMPVRVWKDKYEGKTITNPRNIASGIMNRDEVTEDLHDLDYVIYKVLYSENSWFNSADICDIDTFIEKVFGKCVSRDYVDLKNSGADVLDRLYSEYSKLYPCDGLVLSILEDGLNYDEIAYKFKAESCETTVIDVVYSASRTGRVVPVITFNTVVLSGANVSQCTGYNAEFIKNNKIGPGAVIEVCRSNEVIPTILGVLSPAEEGKLPDSCPNCGHRLVWKGTDLICERENYDQLAYNFITTVAPVDGAGWRLYSDIIESLVLETEEDLSEVLFTIKNAGSEFVYRTIVERGIISGRVTLDKAKEVIVKLSQPIDPVIFLVACNVNGVSWNTAEKILKSYPNYLEESNHPNVDKLYEVPGVGSSTVETLVKFGQRIHDLYDSVTIDMSTKKDDKVEVKFKVAITGSLSITRAKFVEMLNSHGIETSDNFKEIKYLITNNPNSGSSKMKRAKEQGIEVISETEFVDKFLN